MPDLYNNDTIIRKFSLVVSTPAQGTRKLLEISSFAISIGI